MGAQDEAVRELITRARRAVRDSRKLLGHIPPPQCPRCGSDQATCVGEIRQHEVYICRTCRTQFTRLIGD